MSALTLQPAPDAALTGDKLIAVPALAAAAQAATGQGKPAGSARPRRRFTATRPLTVDDPTLRPFRVF